MKSAFLAGAVVVLAACGGTRFEGQDQPDFEVSGIGVKMESTKGLAWTSAPDLGARISKVVDVAARFAGHDPSELQGWVLVIQDDRITCGDVPGVAGCTWMARGEMAVSTMPFMWAECVEQTALAHEVVHAVLGGDGDPCHRNPIWHDFGPVAAGLADAKCGITVSTWQQHDSCHGA